MAAGVSQNILKSIVCVFSCAVVTGSIVLVAQSAEQLASEAKRSTPAGATFTAPAAWSLRSEANMIVLTPPEPDSHWEIGVEKAADDRAAVCAGWSAYHPAFKRPVKLRTPSPPRDGWD